MAARLSFILIVLAAGCTEAKMPPVTKHRVISLSPAATSVVTTPGMPSTVNHVALCDSKSI